MSPNSPTAVGVRRCVGVMDIGTNTVMTLAAVAGPDGDLWTEEQFQTTRLGEGVSSTGLLSAEAQLRSLMAVRAQRDHLQSSYRHGVAVAVATSAVRDACNADEFLGSCADILGARPVVLRGVDEARLAFRGAVSDRAAGVSVLDLDVGGGSTEVSWGTSGCDCDAAASVDVGCVRLAERFGLGNRSHEDAIVAAREAIRHAFSRPLAKLKRDGVTAALGVVASGGSATTYAAMAQALDVYDRDRVHGYTSTYQALNTVVSRLFRMSSAERQRLPGIPADRASVLPSGLLILDEVLGSLGTPTFSVSTRGLRHGLALAVLAGEWAPSWSW